MKKILAVIVAIIFVALALAVVTSQGTTSTAASPAAAQTASEQGSNARLLAIEKKLEAQGIPMKDASFPAMINHVSMENGVVEPSYASAPAPMGIGFYGTQNMSGHLMGYECRLLCYVPVVYVHCRVVRVYRVVRAVCCYGYSETFQLNSVLTNVTLFGNSTYTFWTQKQ